MLKLTPKRRVLFVHRLTPVLLVFFGVFSLVFLNLTRSPLVANAAAANTVNFQARLQTNSGAIVPDGNYNVEFKLYSGSSCNPTTGTGCTNVWTEDYLNSASQGLQTINGYLSANLGSVTSFPNTIQWDQKLWLSMNIGGTTSGSVSWDGAMLPYLSLTAVPAAFSASQLATTSASGRSTLTFQGSSSGDQSFVIQDQGAAGTYNLLTTNQANNAYIQLQGSSPGSAQTGSFNITGTGIAGALQAATFDTPSGTNTLNIATSNATTINLGTAAAVTNVAGRIVVNGASTFGTAAIKVNTGGVDNLGLSVIGVSGQQYPLIAIGQTGVAYDIVDAGVNGVTIRPVSDSGVSFAVQRSDSANNLLAVDNSTNTVSTANLYANGNVTVNAGYGITIQNGGLNIQGGGVTGYVSPNGSNIATKINVPNFDPGLYGQIIAMGLPSTADSTARVITLLDARTGAHQPSINLLDPAENQVYGLSWDGSSTTALLKTSANNLALQANGINELTATYNSGVGQVTVNGNTILGASAGSGTVTNNGATVNTMLGESDYPTGGSIGSAASTVDVYSDISITQTTSGQTLSLPAPTASSTYGRTVTVNNIGTAAFVINTTTIQPGFSATFVWSFSTGAPTWQATTGGNSIFNQNSATQTGNFNISGTGQAGTLQAATVNSTTGYQINGTSGATTTCSSGQFLQNQVVVGGIVTGGTCAAVGGSGVTTVGALDTNGFSTSANGATISGTTIYLQSASASFAGLVNTVAQTFAGDKTFSGSVILGSSSNFDQSASSGTFKTGTGAVSLNGSTTVATGKSLTVTSGATSLTGSSAGSSTAVSISAGAASNLGLKIQAASGQTANLYELRDSSNALLMSNSATGNLSTYGTPTTFNGLDFPQSLSATAFGGTGTTTYYYEVTSVNNVAETRPSNEVSLTNAPNTLNTSTYVNVTFNAVVGAKSYNIYRGTTSGSEQLIGSVTADGVSASYTYADQNSAAGSGNPPSGAANALGPVVTINGGGGAMTSGGSIMQINRYNGNNGAPANVVNVTYLGQMQMKATATIGNDGWYGLGTPDLALIQGTNTSGNTLVANDLLQFQDSHGDALGGINYTGSLYSNGGGATLGSLTVPTGVTSSTSGGTTYYYKVTAYNNIGETTASSEVSGSGSATTISWTAVPGATGYHIYRGTTSGGEAGYFDVTNGTTTSKSNTQSMTLTGSSAPPATTVGTGLTIQGWNGQTSNLLQVQNSTGTSTYFSVTSAGANIMGTGTATVGYQAPSFDTGSAAALNIGTTNASSINIGKTSGSVLTTVNGTMLVQMTGGNNSTTAFQVQDTSNNSLFNVDSGSGEVHIDYAHVNAGTINHSLVFGGASSTEGIGSNRQATGYNSYGLDFYTNSTNVFSLTNSGAATFKNGTNSANAFQVQNTSGYNILGADTSAGQAILGTASQVSGSLKFMSSTGTGSVSLNLSNGASAGNYTITLPSITANDVVCLQNKANCGSGTTTHSKQVILTPEYAGATLNASNDTGGTTNCSLNSNGTMTSGSNAGTPNWNSFYQWVGNNGTTNQCYDVVVRIPMPSDISDTAPAPALTINGLSSDGSAAMNVDVHDTTNTQDGTAYQAITLGTNTWTSSTITLNSSPTAYAANGVMTVRIRMTAKSTNYVQLGNLVFSYTSKY